MSKLQQTFNKFKFKTIKYSPEILMVTGIVGIVGAGVLACRSTLRLSDVLTAKTKTVEQIHELKESDPEAYPEETYKKDLQVVYATSTLEIIKMYAPAVALGTASIICLISSHNVLKNRNVALAAAFATVTESFTNYRKEVVNRYGDRTDFEIRNGIRTEKVSTTEVDENGKKKTKKVDIDVVDGLTTCSEYAKFYDSNCTSWTNDPEMNLYFLQSQERYANDKLRAKGFLYLNDVYEALGIKETIAGQIVGWIYDTENPNGDNRITFGMHNVNIAGYRDEFANETIAEERVEFINGYKTGVLLDFNVDGNILDLM